MTLDMVVSLFIKKKNILIKRMHTIGMKNVVKKVKKVAEGKMKDEGKVWFTELRDKRMLFLYKPFEISIIFSFYLSTKHVLQYEELWWIS